MIHWDKKITRISVLTYASFVLAPILLIVTWCGKRYKAVQLHSKISQHIQGLFFSVSCIALQVILLAFLLYDLGIFFYLKENNAIRMDSWSIGQIIAVLTWAPVVCKLIHQATCKCNIA